MCSGWCTYRSISKSIFFHAEVEAALDSSDSYNPMFHCKHLQPAWKTKKVRVKHSRGGSRNHIYIFNIKNLKPEKLNEKWIKTTSELTELGWFVNASHRATGKNLQMITDPNPTVKQLLFDFVFNWRRTWTCFIKRWWIVVEDSLTSTPWGIFSISKNDL